MDAIEKYRARRAKRMSARTDEFEENDHPRDENGRFTSGGSTEKTGSKPTKTGAKPKSAPKVDEQSVKSAIGEAKTRQSIVKALKGAGYKVKDLTDETYDEPGTRFNLRIEKDGGYVRIYGKRGDVKTQTWGTAKSEPIEVSKEEYDKNFSKIDSFRQKMKKEGRTNFSDMKTDDEKWSYVALDTFKHMTESGMSGRMAMKRAIDNANSHKESGFRGYRDGSKSETEEWKEFFGKMAKDIKR